jgi:predicted AlkP superfamily phosphohydrolase/phosphomutase
VSEPIRKTLLLGFELGDGALLRRWAGEGRLPAVAALLARGRSGTLATPAELLHVSPLPSLYTGAEPGRHGVYFTFQPAPGVQGWQRFHDGLYGVPTLWAIAARAGRRCTVFDVPYCHPEPGYTGRYLNDWGNWAQYQETRAVPQGLLAELERAVGKYPLGMEAHDLGFGVLEAGPTAERLVRALDARSRATTWLMGSEPWDLFVTVLDETHPAAHYCWLPPPADATEPPAEQPHLLRVYEALDRAIGAIVAAAGPDTTILVVSGDAIGANRAGWHLLPDILGRLGLFASADSPAGPATGDAAASRAKPGFDPVKAVRDLLPKDFRKQLARLLPTKMRDQLAKRVDTAAVDWSRTKAYWLLTDLEGCIRVNLRGREPQGIVAPGAEYEAVLDELERELAALIDPRTREPAVTRILRADRDLPGERRDHLPDLVVHWSRAAPITALSSARIGTVEGVSPDPRPGTHAGPGFAVIAGPEIGQGALPATASLYDVAPTVLARLGLPPAASMAGRSWVEAATMDSA